MIDTLNTKTIEAHIGDLQNARTDLEDPAFVFCQRPYPISELNPIRGEREIIGYRSAAEACFRGLVERQSIVEYEISRDESGTLRLHTDHELRRTIFLAAMSAIDFNPTPNHDQWYSYKRDLIPTYVFSIDQENLRRLSQQMNIEKRVIDLRVKPRSR